MAKHRNSYFPNCQTPPTFNDILRGVLQLGEGGGVCGTAMAADIVVVVPFAFIDRVVVVSPAKQPEAWPAHFLRLFS